jgi:hypothetical protein
LVPRGPAATDRQSSGEPSGLGLEYLPHLLLRLLRPGQCGAEHLGRRESTCAASMATGPQVLPNPTLVSVTGVGHGQSSINPGSDSAAAAATPMPPPPPMPPPGPPPMPPPPGPPHSARHQRVHQVRPVQRVRPARRGDQAHPVRPGDRVRPVHRMVSPSAGSRQWLRHYPQPRLERVVVTVVRVRVQTPCRVPGIAGTPLRERLRLSLSLCRVPNPTNPKPAAITAFAAEKRAESFISPCYPHKLWTKIKEAEKS